MVERKLYKTRLCMLYQRGRCPRQYCNFAHGDAELRHSLNDYDCTFFGILIHPSHPRKSRVPRGRDLRERLDRMRSPLHNSPERRNPRTRHSSHGGSPRSLGKMIDRNTRKRKQLDGHSDYSGRMSDGTDNQIKDRRPTYSDAKILLDEQLREMHSEIKMLEGDKQQLEMYLDDKVKEADSLTFRIHELEMQLSKEKEEGKRFTAKIKEFTKAHKRHLRLQDELKRSHAKLQKLGEQLNLDAARTGNEDDSNALTDDINGGFASTLNDGQMNSAPHRTRSHVNLEDHDASTQAGGRNENGRSRVEKLPRPSGNRARLSNSHGKKSEADGDAYDSRGPLSSEDKSKRGKTLPADISSADKYKASETGLILPTTGIAAHAIDEDVEVVETDDKFQEAAEAGAYETGVSLRTQRLPFLPPPPPIPPNAYAQYEGDNENDISGADEEEAVDVDIV